MGNAVAALFVSDRLLRQLRCKTVLSSWLVSVARILLIVTGYTVPFGRHDRATPGFWQNCREPDKSEYLRKGLPRKVALDVKLQ